MSIESTVAFIGDESVVDDFRRLFRCHVVAVVLTGALVFPLLLCIASLPSWLFVATCILIATVAVAFVAIAGRTVENHRERSVVDRLQFVALTVSLSMLQAIFVLPVFICVFAPTLRV